MKTGTKYEAKYLEKCQKVGGERGRHRIQIWDPKDIIVSKTSNHKQNLQDGWREGGIYSRGKNTYFS